MINLMELPHADVITMAEVIQGQQVVAFCPECNKSRYGTEERSPYMGIFHVINERCILNVIADCGEGWDHVSVSVHEDHRCPTWEEMEAVKRAFFAPEECAMQLHVPVEDHVSIHPYVLHIWRPHGISIPVPPKSRL